MTISKNKNNYLIITKTKLRIRKLLSKNKKTTVTGKESEMLNNNINNLRQQIDFLRTENDQLKQQIRKINDRLNNFIKKEVNNNENKNGEVLESNDPLEKWQCVMIY